MSRFLCNFPRIMRRAIYPGSFDPVTNGHLDQVAVPDIKEWERGFLEFAESQFPQVPQRFKSEKVLSMETEADLKRALENYNRSFGYGKIA